ncbi:hypothetical protein [Kitasatospora sp. NBC_01300]|uniref:hypothetical protein n=1 Tax=Kitasatospora sp. NBC_01300 TaxID=2903574 RepID=UPI00352EF970|nr:hypothetical protein OG556_01110 [Kitasatospora sp. NBC_01300]WSK08216.1 hypothetical protein OG556_32610 [Kitasatospora sp. NBC_01300]
MSMATPTARRLGLTAATLALALTACGHTGAGVGDEHPAPETLTTPEQAVQKLDALLDDALSGIQPPLRHRDGWPRSTEQSGGIDDHSKGYATATRDRYIMTKVSKAKYATLMDMAERDWKAKGYKITSVNPNQPALFAAAPDGSSVAMLFGAAGNITLQASGGGHIPVIRDRDPFGTPTPEPTLPNGNPDILPAYDDPYWST